MTEAPKIDMLSEYLNTMINLEDELEKLVIDTALLRKLLDRQRIDPKQPVVVNVEIIVGLVTLFASSFKLLHEKGIISVDSMRKAFEDSLKEDDRTEFSAAWEANKEVIDALRRKFDGKAV